MPPAGNFSGIWTTAQFNDITSKFDEYDCFLTSTLSDAEYGNRMSKRSQSANAAWRKTAMDDLLSLVAFQSDLPDDHKTVSASVYHPHVSNTHAETFDIV